MNRRFMILLLVTLSFFSVGQVHSQAPAADQNAAVSAALEALKAGNDALIQRQEKTIEALEALRVTAAQLKVLGKRS